MVDRSVRKDSLSCDPKAYHLRQQVEGDAAGVTTREVRPHASVNHAVFFLFHGFNKFMYINKILMKT